MADQSGNLASQNAPDPVGTAAEVTDAALKAAEDAIARAKGQTGPGPEALDLQSFDVGSIARSSEGIDLLGDVNLNVRIELGRTRMFVEDVLRLGEGSVVELDKLAGDPVDVFVNDRHIARGEVLVLNDSFCVRISEIISSVGPRK